MTGTIIVYAPNVHTGGGLVLLQALLRSLPAGSVRRAFLDQRARAQLAPPAEVSADWVDVTVSSRLAAEFGLRRASGGGDTVLCFHGLPPLLPSRSRVVVFLQNRLYLGRERSPSIAMRTALRLGFERQVARRLRRRVDAYIVQTPTMARALAKWFGEGSPTVRVLPFADEWTPPDAGAQQTPPSWDFVYVADGEAHKNHRRLLQAWQLLAEAGLHPRLALTLSPRDAEVAAEVARLRETAAIEVQDLGPLSREEVLSLYRRTRALVFASTAESFGLPLVEAAQLGVPVLAPELDYVRDVCVPVQTFDPMSPHSIARAVRRFLGCAEPPITVSKPEALWAALEAPVKILVFSQHFWPESFRINDVALSLRRAGHEVVVLTGQPNYPGGTVFDGYRAGASGTEHHEGLRIERVPLVPRGRGGARRLMANYLSFIASAALFGAWRLRGQRFDVVLVYATSPLLQALAAIVLARLKSCALVTWVQDLWPQSLQATGYVTNKHALALVGRVVRFIYARHTLLLVQSAAFVPPVRALTPPQVPIRVHANPGAEEPVGAVDAPPALRLDAGFNIVFAGNLGTAQALDAVVEAAERLHDLPDLRFVLIGSGSRVDWLARQVRERGLGNVQLPGRFAPEQMAPILAQAQALLVSLVDDPAMALTVPSKVQSYLAAGRPVIAALRGEGARIVLESGAGVACEPARGDALADAARQLHAMPEAERARMGAAGRRRYDEAFSPARLTPALIAHLQAAAATIRPRRSDPA